MGDVIGLIEWLDARGGQDDVFRIAAETGREFGHLLRRSRRPSCSTSSTPRNGWRCSPRRGRPSPRPAPEARKALWREKLLAFRLFADVRDALQQAPDHRLPRDFVLETIVMRMPAEDYDRVFDVWIGWARYGDLFAYDENDGMVGLQ